MNTQTLDSLKIDLIVRITKSDDEGFLHHIKEEFDELNKKGLTEKQRDKLKKLVRPIRKKTDLEQLKREQKWKPSTKEEIRKLTEKFDFQISAEELLKEIRDI